MLVYTYQRISSSIKILVTTLKPIDVSNKSRPLFVKDFLAMPIRACRHKHRKLRHFKTARKSKNLECLQEGKPYQTTFPKSAIPRWRTRVPDYNYCRWNEFNESLKRHVKRCRSFAQATQVDPPNSMYSRGQKKVYITYD